MIPVLGCFRELIHLVRANVQSSKEYYNEVGSSLSGANLSLASRIVSHLSELPLVLDTLLAD